MKALWLLLLALGPGCHARVGDGCREANEDCLDDHTKLVCKNGRFVPLKCDGPKGCAVDKAMGKARCDWSGNKQGSKCDDRFIGMRMCRDAKSALACRSGQFDMLRCRGPQGCKPESGEADSIAKTCDTSLAKAGDTCDPVLSSAPACEAEEGKSELRCNKAGVFAFERNCRGPKGCSVQDGKAVCDQSIQDVGDSCVKSPDLCTADGKAMLVCSMGTVTEKSCPGPGGCSVVPGSGTACDTGTSFEGVPCSKKGQQACTPIAEVWSDEPGKLLECNGKTFEVAKTCSGGCLFTPPSTFDCKEKEKEAKPKKK